MDWFKKATRPTRQPPPQSDRQRYVAIWLAEIKRKLRKRSGKPSIAQWQFLNWVTDGSPSFNPEIKDAADTGNWVLLRSLCIHQRRQLYHSESLFPHERKESNHEFAIRDIFFICGIPFEYQVDKYMGADGKVTGDEVDKETGEVTNEQAGGGTHIVADFAFPDGRIFEIFGVRFADYRKRNFQKTVEFANELWYLNLMHVSVESDNVALLGYARVLDDNVCHKMDCGMSLFSFSVEQLLTRKVPLLFGKNLDLCKNYILQLANMGPDQLAKNRSNVERKRQRYPSQFGGPSYTPPDDSALVRDQYGDVVPPMFQINRVSPLAKMKERQREWAANPIPMSRGVGRVAQAMPPGEPQPQQPQQPQQQQAPTLAEIEQSLQQQYRSVGLWSDEEKVAVYFKTPKALMQALRSIQPAQPMRMVARNWYERMKVGIGPKEQA